MIQNPTSKKQSEGQKGSKILILDVAVGSERSSHALCYIVSVLAMVTVHCIACNKENTLFCLLFYMRSYPKSTSLVPSREGPQSILYLNRNFPLTIVWILGMHHSSLYTNHTRDSLWVFTIPCISFSVTHQGLCHCSSNHTMETIPFWHELSTVDLGFH